MNVAEFKQQILKEYLEWVDEVSDACEWKTHFTSRRDCF
jgi:hypothetical protein